MLKIIPFIFLSALACIGGCNAHASNLQLPENFVAAEIQVESSGRNNAIGDDGKAIGCLQIHIACWQDAKEMDSSLQGNYSNCFSREYSIKVMRAYLNRYCPDAIRKNDFETMARTWNGGANGRNNPRTLDYWRRVKLSLKNS